MIAKRLFIIAMFCVGMAPLIALLSIAAIVMHDPTILIGAALGVLWLVRIARRSAA